MTSTPIDARSRVLEAARDAVTARMRAEVDLLAAAAEWAIMHPATEASDDAGFGVDLLFGEGLTPLAGEGAPLVAEFAPAELAAVLGWSTPTVQQLIGDALELRCRLRGVWDHVLGLRLPVRLARYVAEQTRDLDADAANRADRMLAAGDPGRLTRRSAHRIIDEVRLHEDPDRAVADEQHALAARRVELRPGTTPATTEVMMSLDTADAEAFDQTASRLARVIRDLGDDDDDFEVLRARAVGILADPQAALDLLHRGTTPTRKTGGSPALYLHLDLATLADLAVHGVTGPVWEETRGVATTDLIRDWLRDWLGPDAQLKVQPWLDLNHPETLAPVTGHHPTAAMAFFVRLRDPHCVFPGCTRPSRRCDLDHIEAYVPPDDGGPPGQTHPDNLAPAVPTPPSGQDPRPMDLPTPRGRRLPVDFSDPPHHRRTTGTPTPGGSLTPASPLLASGGLTRPPPTPSYDGGREEAAMADPVGDIIGDYRAFAAQQHDRLLARGIDIRPYPLSHLAVRVPEWDQYAHVRNLLERHAVANRENVWNGRPISLIVPTEPLEVLDDKVVPLIELIPPVHQRVYKMGLEHLGVVVGDTFDAFVAAHKPVLTGQQFQGPNSTPDPVYILFEDFTHVKFYRLSLRASVELDAGPFDDGFHHVDDWVPQRLLTATGPNPLPR